MRKIVFVNSLWNTKDKLAIPIGLLSLSTILKDNGYETEIIDFNYLYKTNRLKKSEISEENIRYMAEHIIKQKPQLIAFHSVCNSYHINLMVAKYIKDIHSNIPIVFGGPQASVTATSSLQAFPWIDLISIGEGEKTIERIVQAFDSKGSFSNIKGIAYREGGQIKQNSELELIEDLDDLPDLDYSLIPYINDLDTVYIEAGRGCPYSCTYCSTKTFWKQRFRLKSVQRLVSEITHLHSNYNKINFSLIHDLFTANREKVIEFCERIIKEKLPIQWTCSARVDTLDKELIEKMSKAGCTGIFLGIETGSPRMQKLIKKNLNLHDTWKKINLLKEHSIEMKLSFIYGFPDETFNDIRMTLDMIQKGKELGVKKIQLYLFSFFVGTELFKKHRNTLELDNTFSELVGDLNVEGCRDIITEYPDIFPHFYNLNTEVRSTLKNLDIFVSAYYSSMYDDLKCTYKYLNEYYNNDLLEFFFDICKYTPDFFIEAKYNHSYLYSAKTSTDIALLKLENLRRFINYKNFGEHNDKIREMFEFEFAIFSFLHINQTNIEEEHKYKFDIFNAKQKNLKLNELESRPIKLKFTRYKPHKLKIEKYNLSQKVPV